MKLGVVFAPGGAVSVRELVANLPAGLELTLVVRRTVATARPEVVDVAARVLDVVVLDDELTTHSLARLAHLDDLLTFSDSEIEFTEQVLAASGRPTSPPGTWAKGRQRAALVEAGLSRIAWRRCDFGALPDALLTFPAPFIVKPDRGAGGAGVLWVPDDEGRSSALEWITNQGLRDCTWVLERAIDPVPQHPILPWLGPLLSVETYSDHHGFHHHITCFAKLRSQAVDVGAGTHCHTVRVWGDIHPAGLSPDTEAEAVALVHAGLAALGVRSRITHTEILLTSAGAEIVEVNGRMGGFLSRLTALTHGVQLTSLALATSLSGEPPEALGPPFQMAAGLFPSFKTLRGRVLSEVAARDVLAIPGVAGLEGFARPGQDYGDVDARLANITVAAPSFSRLEVLVRTAFHELAKLYSEDGGPSTTFFPNVSSAPFGPP